MKKKIHNNNSDNSNNKKEKGRIPSSENPQWTHGWNNDLNCCVN